MTHLGVRKHPVKQQSGQCPESIGQLLRAKCRETMIFFGKHTENIRKLWNIRNITMVFLMGKNQRGSQMFKFAKFLFVLTRGFCRWIGRRLPWGLKGEWIDSAIAVSSAGLWPRFQSCEKSLIGFDPGVDKGKDIPACYRSDVDKKRKFQYKSSRKGK